jgi:cell division protein FtsW
LAALVLLPVALIVAEPDLGTAIIVATTGLAVFFAGGASLLQFPLLGAGAGALLAVAIKVAPYRFSRFLVFLHPWENAQGVSYQIQQSLLALGSGGLFGLGLGASRQKFSYLPAPHTDSIFAIIGEELGFVGCLGVILLFVALAWRGFTIAREAPDQFGALLATGITASLVVQAFINVAAVSASIPFTGVPLPFISYGGSSLIISLAGIGILLNVAAQRAPGTVAVAEPPPARRPQPLPLQPRRSTPAAPRRQLAPRSFRRARSD